MKLEVKTSNEVVFALYENDNVLVKDDPAQLGVVATLLQEALEFVTGRLSIVRS